MSVVQSGMVRLGGWWLIGTAAVLLGCAGRAESTGAEPEPDGVRETCADNPLVGPCDSGESADETPEGIVRRAEDVLSGYCAACHGATAVLRDGIQGGLRDIERWQRLIAKGYVIACAPERSPLIEVIRSGSMPPPDSGFRLDPPDIERLVAAIDVGCSEEQKRCAVEPLAPACQ